MKLIRLSLSVALAAVAAATALFAQAGPPMLTDDPGTAPKGKVEWNTAFNLLHNRDGSSEKLLPLIDISYGVSESVEVSYESHWAIVKEVGEPSKAGWDDTTLACKWRFWDEEKDGVDMAFQPQFTFNTGSSAYRRGVVAKNSDLLLPFEIGKTLGPVVLNLEFGRDFHAHQGAEDDFWFAGATLGHKFNEKTEGVAELYVPRVSRDFKRGTLLLNLGCRYELGESSSLLLSAGTGLAGVDRPDFLCYLGIQRVF